MFKYKHGKHDDEYQFEHVTKKQKKWKILTRQSEQGQERDNQSYVLKSKMQQSELSIRFDHLFEADDGIDKTEKHQRVTCVDAFTQQQHVSRQGVHER